MFYFIFRSNAPSRRGGQTKQRPEAKMPLQTIHMTSENQRRVKELLQELQGQELAPESELVEMEALLLALLNEDNLTGTLLEIKPVFFFH